MAKVIRHIGHGALFIGSVVGYAAIQPSSAAIRLLSNVSGTMTVNTPDRCRIVLVAPLEGDPHAVASQVSAALDGGDVASLIVPRGGRDPGTFQALAEALVPLAQARGVAAIIEGDTRVAGRVGADGVHLEVGKAELAEAVARGGGRMVVGAGGAKTRDDALELGETGPDYLFFGRFGYDNKPEPHPRNLTLGAWWAEVVEIPCIVAAGSDLGSVVAVAATGAEFVALGSAVFASPAPGEAVADANRLLDEAAPRLGGEGANG